MSSPLLHSGACVCLSSIQGLSPAGSSAICATPLRGSRPQSQAFLVPLCLRGYPWVAFLFDLAFPPQNRKSPFIQRDERARRLPRYHPNSGRLTSACGQLSLPLSITGDVRQHLHTSIASALQLGRELQPLITYGRSQSWTPAPFARGRGLLFSVFAVERKIDEGTFQVKVDRRREAPITAISLPEKGISPFFITAIKRCPHKPN